NPRQDLIRSFVSGRAGIEPRSHLLPPFAGINSRRLANLVRRSWSAPSWMIESAEADTRLQVWVLAAAVSCRHRAAHFCHGMPLGSRRRSRGPFARRRQLFIDVASQLGLLTAIRQLCRRWPAVLLANLLGTFAVIIRLRILPNKVAGLYRRCAHVRP